MLYYTQILKLNAEKIVLKKNTCSVCLFFAATLLCSCASTNTSLNDEHDQVDRFENVNRAVFKFNYQFDKYVLKPVAKGYRAITNRFVRERVSTAISNLDEPLNAGNYLLQARPLDSLKSVARFALNTTMGLAGTFDVAEGWGLKKQSTSFNETFAKWCIPSGPYIVLPFIGPSSPRHAAGTALGFVLDPVYWATYNDANIRDKVRWSYTAVQAVAKREGALDLLDDLERNSVDYYITMRSAYLQNQNKLKCFNDVEADENTYDFDFGIEDEDATYEAMEDEN